MLNRIASLVAVVIVSTAYLNAATQDVLSPGQATPSSQRALLNRYCVTCHNEKLKTAALMLDKADVDKPARDAEIWEKVIRKLRTGAMPPSGMPRPDKVASDALAGYLETALDN